MLQKKEFRTADPSAARYPEAERFPDILSEIAGGPKALIRLGLHETGEDRTKEPSSNERFEPCLPFVCALSGVPAGVAKGGRILERRSGDPLLDGPAGKRQPTPDLVNGAGVNWR
ncbi:hypothetical protein [Mesorhizobium sp. CA7]|uniref:hypothetical protein n=1 Tax=Mesorhizobium sp. CA7 TaxID=588501 RepID=UPI001CCB76AF|nr:hypothetical protein [Mesorhizobium sp. CA7]MBZ9816817.1 hypothetical protein [Mesorhizobium sp. CA7]